MLEKKLIKSQYHILFPLFLVIFLTIGVFITVFQSQKDQNLHSEAATTNCTVSQSQLITIKDQESQLFNDVNTYRAQQGVGQLTWSAVLKQSAVWQSDDMLAHNLLSHTDSLGRTPDIRLSDCGYDISNGFGENIAEGSPSATLVFNAWKNDPAHNLILLKSSFNLAGVDYEANVGSQNAFWTMDFGTSPPGITPTTPVGVTGTTSPIPTTQVSGPSPSDISNFPGLTPTIGPVTADMLISMTVTINGIGPGGNVTPQHLTRKITATVFSTGSAPVTTGTGFLTYSNGVFSGTIHLGQMSQGPYLIKIGSDNTLQVLAQPVFQMLLINRVNVIPPVTLYLGDLNGDNVLDINDYNLALPCFQTRTCTTMSLDFNDDGVINVLDYNLFLQSFEVLHGD